MQLQHLHIPLLFPWAPSDRSLAPLPSPYLQQLPHFHLLRPRWFPTFSFSALVLPAQSASQIYTTPTASILGAFEISGLALVCRRDTPPPHRRDTCRRIPPNPSRVGCREL